MEPENKLSAAPTAPEQTPEDLEEMEDGGGHHRKVGVARFFEVLGRDLWPFYKSSFLCVVGFVPGYAALLFSVMAGSLPLSLLSGAVGGLIAGPFLCGMYDTILRALRDEPGYWWHTYRMAWKQNWKDALLPGALVFIALGLICGSLLSERQVGGICGALLTNLSAWLSGAWFDLKLIGGGFEAFAYALPFANAVDAARAALAGRPAGTALLVSCAYAALLCALAVVVFARRMRRS